MVPAIDVVVEDEVVELVLVVDVVVVGPITVVVVAPAPYVTV